MAYTATDLIRRALKDSNVLGRGQNATPEDITDGLAMVNRLLAQHYTEGAFQPAVVSQPVVFTGVADYTVGPMPDLALFPLAPVPDIVMNVAPGLIKEVVFYSNQARLLSLPTSPGAYFSRGVNVVSNPYPSHFYYERTSPLATIRFIYGTPVGQSEIIYTPSHVGVGSSTDLESWNPDLLAFIEWQTAADMAALNRWDNTWLQGKANGALASYKSTNRRDQSYIVDRSAPGLRSPKSGKWNLYDGELV